LCFCERRKDVQDELAGLHIRVVEAVMRQVGFNKLVAVSDAERGQLSHGIGELGGLPAEQAPVVIPDSLVHKPFPLRFLLRLRAEFLFGLEFRPSHHIILFV
jgi:hypothetical protein